MLVRSPRNIERRKIAFLRVRKRQDEETNEGNARRKMPSMPVAKISNTPFDWFLAKPKSTPNKNETAKTIRVVFAGWGSERKYLERTRVSFLT